MLEMVRYVLRSLPLRFQLLEESGVVTLPARELIVDVVVKDKDNAKVVMYHLGLKVDRLPYIDVYQS